ncbi:MAG: Imm30 family immunity protein [Cyanobacteria bacterium P01_A01_bin.40]
MSSSILNDLIISLKLLEQNPENPHYFEDFESIVCQIGHLKDPDSISLLMQFLTDESEELQLMWAIIHTIEIFDDEIYIKEILKISPYLDNHFSEWAYIIFVRILNSDKCRIEMIRQLRDSSSVVKTAIQNLMEKINRESSDFLTKTDAVLVAASIDNK